MNKRIGVNTHWTAFSKLINRMIKKLLLIIVLTSLCSCGEKKIEKPCGSEEEIKKIVFNNNHNAQKALVTCLQKHVDNGNIDAQGKLGFIYMTGKIIDKDEKKAIAFFEKAAALGDAYAQSMLALFYMSGDGGVKQNIKKAVKLYEQAADQGYRSAQAGLGHCYYYGLGKEKNLLKAAEFFQKSADQGYSLAQYLLGRMYEEGEGVDKNLSKAEELYKNSSDQGFPPAQEKMREKNLKNLFDAWRKI